jgi:hypothetical protein
MTLRNFLDPLDSFPKKVLIDCGSGIKFPVPFSRIALSTEASFFFAKRIAERRRIQRA